MHTEGGIAAQLPLDNRFLLRYYFLERDCSAMLLRRSRAEQEKPMSWGLIKQWAMSASRQPTSRSSVFDATQILGLRETERTDGTVYLVGRGRHHELVYMESESTESIVSLSPGTATPYAKSGGGSTRKTCRSSAKSRAAPGSRTDSPSSGPEDLSSRFTLACRQTPPRTFLRSGPLRPLQLPPARRDRDDEVPPAGARFPALRRHRG